MMSLKNACIGAYDLIVLVCERLFRLNVETCVRVMETGNGRDFYHDCSYRVRHILFVTISWADI